VKLFSSFCARAVSLSVAMLISANAVAVDKVIVISPHRKSIQDEYIPKFQEYYKKNFNTEVQVDWLDQGGASDDLRFVRAKFAKDPATSGIDIFWGGGASTFIDLSSDKFLAAYQLPADLKPLLPATASGVSMTDGKGEWYASAISSFGIFFNRAFMKIMKITEPTTWNDLADPKYLNKISLADPRRSGTAGQMNMIIIQNLGWEKGWQLLNEVAGNNRAFTHSSSDPIKNVVAGDAVASMAIDFYALAKVSELGTDKLGFALPAAQTVLDPDPIAIMKGAPNRKAAERFVNFVLSNEAQKLLVLGSKETDGPKLSVLGRMAVNTQTYKDTEGRRINPFNPFTEKTMFKLDSQKAAKLKSIVDDLIGAVIIDAHDELKAAWKIASVSPAGSPIRKEFGAMPVTEAELLELSAKWDDNVVRNQKINEWLSFSKAKFKKIASGKQG
jgi:ABC-type Fe3+ transport system substrate-binding protein